MEIIKFYRVLKTLRTKLWSVIVIACVIGEVFTVNESHFCTVKQKYNVTKRVKYRAPMSIRTYEWCFAMPPRCSRWTTEMRDLTRLETEERIAEVAVCCPGYKLKDADCVPICPNGKTGSGCHEDCQKGKWGPNCINVCKSCLHGFCSPINGECECQDGWQGESCEIVVSTTILSTISEELLTSTKPSTKITISSTTPISSSINTTPYVIDKNSILPEVKSTESVFKITNDISTVTDSITVNTLPSTTDVAITEQPTSITEYEPKFLYSTETTSDFNYQNNTERATTNPTTIMTIFYKPLELTTKQPTTIKPKFVTKSTPTTKFKPKEIWIKPSQKGESTLMESKTKVHEFHQKSKTTEYENTSPYTTPKTIVVSIIPTSISYTTFKRLYLTTAQTMKSSNISMKVPAVSFSSHGTNKSSTPTSLFTIKILQTSTRKKSSTSTTNPVILNSVSKSQPYTTFSSSEFADKASTVTNSMIRSTKNINLKSSYIYNTFTSKVFTNPFTNISFERTVTTETIPIQTKKPNSKSSQKSIPTTKSIKLSAFETSKPMKLNVDKEKTIHKELNTTETQKNLTKLTTNVSKTTTNEVTEKLTTSEDDIFHILTEPEHITAVVGESDEKSNSVDLVSVLIIAAGVMMSTITLAVVIVMIERCRRPTYEQVGKLDDLQMAMMMENKDLNTYSRSIFHAPLPDPPISEKSHYQPIETLDRKLKQFMRPVTVQELSPIMLENFRDIIECHYDHLPRRNYNNGVLHATIVRAPSISSQVELRSIRVPSVCESTVETVKCEDLIDETTSEPLYAEIPDWRPAFQHAVEVVNRNGEAVTEL